MHFRGSDTVERSKHTHRGGVKRRECDIDESENNYNAIFVIVVMGILLHMSVTFGLQSSSKLGRRYISLVVGTAFCRLVLRHSLIRELRRVADGSVDRLFPVL